MNRNDWFNNDDDYRNNYGEQRENRTERRISADEEYDRYERDYFDRNYNIVRDREPDYDDYRAPKKRRLFESFRRQPDEYGTDYRGKDIPQNVVVCYPKTYSDIRVLIDSLKHKQSIIADLSKINDSSAQRILDFMSGAVYALSGSMHRLKDSVFILTPAGSSIKVPTEIKKRPDKK